MATVKDMPERYPDKFVTSPQMNSGEVQLALKRERQAPHVSTYPYASLIAEAGIVLAGSFPTMPTELLETAQLPSLKKWLTEKNAEFPLINQFAQIDSPWHAFYLGISDQGELLPVSEFSGPFKGTVKGLIFANGKYSQGDDSQVMLLLLTEANVTSTTGQQFHGYLGTPLETARVHVLRPQYS